MFVRMKMRIKKNLSFMDYTRAQSLGDKNSRDKTLVIVYVIMTT